MVGKENFPFFIIDLEASSLRGLVYLEANLSEKLSSVLDGGVVGRN